LSVGRGKAMDAEGGNGAGARDSTVFVRLQRRVGICARICGEALALTTLFNNLDSSMGRF
jgi:hypothetical protein